MLVKYGVPRDIKCKKTKIVGFKYKINDFNYVFACDPDDVNQISFKEIKVLREKNSIPFKTQTFTQLVTQMRVKYYDELKGSIKFSKEFKHGTSFTKKAGNLRRGKVENRQAFVLEQPRLSLLNR